MLTTQHKLDRPRFVKKAFRRELVSWLRARSLTASTFLCTVKKNLLADGASEGQVPDPRKALLYMGSCRWGTTKLMSSPCL